jgi:GNAT superfamily N-acetyltransferase
MLAEAANWDPARARVAIDALAHYVDGWPRAGDAGVIADDDAGTPVGAAWYRHFTAGEHGYGFVDEATPEVSIAVVAEWRGRGIGTDLLAALAELARRNGVGALSLSVERANPARRLYERAGYVPVADDGDAITMRVDLRPRNVR